MTLFCFMKNHLKIIKKKNQISKSHSLKIFVSNKNKKLSIDYDEYLQIPTTLKEINNIVEKIVAKKKFSNNSSIEVKGYVMDKNEKRLSKENNFVILTEKEIKLIELLLNSTEPISKNKILSSVWNYSTSADTHTVETHIYRLRKKISKKFMDENFILNYKNGYSF